MKLAFVDLSGFRGFSGPIRISFSDTFTIIDGRNGVGKSTIFDAVEFALTGTISKYLDATAAGESVDDYLWYNGDSQVKGERYVKLVFDDGVEQYSIKRTPFNTSDLDVSDVIEKLIDRNFAPNTAITQICAASIIRDEHIARLSLDLKEGERFTLLRDAIGAIDAEEWINKASRIVSETSKRVNDATSELDDANNFLTNSRNLLDKSTKFDLNCLILPLLATQLSNFNPFLLQRLQQMRLGILLVEELLRFRCSLSHLIVF